MNMKIEPVAHIAAFYGAMSLSILRPNVYLECAYAELSGVKVDRRIRIVVERGNAILSTRAA